MADVDFEYLCDQVKCATEAAEKLADKVVQIQNALERLTEYLEELEGEK